MAKLVYDESMFSTLAHLFTPKHTNNHRARLLHPEGFVVLIAIAFMFQALFKQFQSTSFGRVLGYASSITVSQVLDLTNKARTAQGENALSLNEQLNQAALAKAVDMFNEQYWARNSPSGKTPWVFVRGVGYKYSAAGENLARDFGDAPSMVNAWMASPSHKANILQDKYKDIGIAVVDGKLNGIETTLVVQLFGKPTATTPNILQQSEQTTQATLNTARVLSDVVSFTQPLISPVDLTRSVFLAIVGLVLIVLIIDSILAKRKNLVRVVGKNLAHIALLTVILVMLIVKKGGLLL